MKVAIYGICKNEEKHMEAYLAAAADANCVVLGDTGSEDRTKEIFAEHATTKAILHDIRVMPFRFDDARNAVMALVPPDVDVCISLDLDEHLCDGWRAILEGHYRAVADRYLITYKREGCQDMTHNSRVHARSGWRWDSPCHEGLYPTGLPQINEKMALDLIIHHCPDATKPRSYLKLLKMGLDEQPHNSRRIFYYARELMYGQSYDKAIGWFNRYLEIVQEYPGYSEFEEALEAREHLALCQNTLKAQLIAPPP